MDLDNGNDAILNSNPNTIIHICKSFRPVLVRRHHCVIYIYDELTLKTEAEGRERGKTGSQGKRRGKKKIVVWPEESMPRRKTVPSEGPIQEYRIARGTGKARTKRTDQIGIERRKRNLEREHQARAGADGPNAGEPVVRLEKDGLPRGEKRAGRNGSRIPRWKRKARKGGKAKRKTRVYAKNVRREERKEGRKGRKDEKEGGIANREGRRKKGGIAALTRLLRAPPPIPRSAQQPPHLPLTLDPHNPRQPPPQTYPRIVRPREPRLLSSACCVRRSWSRGRWRGKRARDARRQAAYVECEGGEDERGGDSRALERRARARPGARRPAAPAQRPAQAGGARVLPVILVLVLALVLQRWWGYY
ncbi:hypothetical protein C8R44DRAFT_745198 [Mycena epipterygia]|nr:hypothetical protein C8R44DRAFT_745198 [Mycena epipterygia]